MNRDDSNLESHLGIDADRLDTDIRRRLSKFVASREQRLIELRERAIDAEQEVKVLEQRIDSLQDQLASQDTSGGDREATAMALEPTTLLSTFGEALQSEQLTEAGFTVSNINVDLRANVVSTEEGVRVNLPKPGVQVQAESLSDLRFSVRADPSAPELELDEVPDLIGVSEETARQSLSDTGFVVGTVETVPSDAEAGRVVGQLPSPFSLAEPGAAVDLEVAEEDSPAMLDLIGQSLADAVQFVGDRFTLRDITSVESEKPPGTIVEQDPPPGEAIEEREEMAFTISAFRSPEPSRDEQPHEEEAPPETEDDSNNTADESSRREEDETPEASEGTSVGEDTAETDDRELDEGHTGIREAIEKEVREDETSLVEHDVTDIDGIGDTYGQRLRAAGVESLADLAVAEPFEVADAANVSRNRARGWIDAVHTRIQSGPESARNSDQDEDE